MSDRWNALGKKLQPDWGAERERSARVGLERRAIKRRVTTRVAASAIALALIAGGISSFARWRSRAVTASAIPSEVPDAPSHGPATVTVVQLSPETLLEPMPDSHGRGVALRAGGARFTVEHDAARPFIVVAGDISIEDLGTTFTVQYLALDRLDVSVDEGRVKVHGAGGDTEIAAGSRAQFAVSAAPAEQADAGSAPAELSDAGSTAVSHAPSSWRPLAESGRYDEAHTALKKAGPNAVRDETADLLLAADAARLSGFPAEAVPYLERVVRAHARDPRSSLAAFTLGRVLLDELGRPREAADAFARARAAGGPLAEDALAREVEATSRAGDTTKSRELALEYQKLYPRGRRAKAVSRFGGLD